jgi:putative transposase
MGAYNLTLTVRSSHYMHGTSYSDIRDHPMDMYGLEASIATISRVTDKISQLIKEWRSRPWLDTIHYKVRHEGRVVVNRAVYCIIGNS